MARGPLTVWGGTVVMSSFVMGVEMVLLLLYIRLEINTAAKKAVRRQVASQLGEGANDPIDPQEVGMDALAAHMFKNGNAEKAYLDAGGAGLMWLAMVSYFLLALLGSGASFYALRSTAVRTPVEEGSWTVGVMTLGALGTILLGQYLFVKLAVIPFYADTYNKIVEEEKHVPRLEKDDWKLTLKLLSPTLVALSLAIVAGVAGRRSVAWKLVLASAAMTGVTGLIEILSWGLMKGIAVPMDHVVAAVNNAALIVSSKDDKDTKIAMLDEVLFEGKKSDLSLSTYVDHVRGMYWSRKDVKLAPDGKIQLVPAANAGKSETGFLLLCSLALLLVPAGAIAFRANLKDSASLAVQCGALLVSYSVFIAYVGRTTTMQKIAKGLR